MLFFNIMRRNIFINLKRNIYDNNTKYFSSLLNENQKYNNFISTADSLYPINYNKTMISYPCSINSLHYSTKTMDAISEINVLKTKLSKEDNEKYVEWLRTGERFCLPNITEDIQLLSNNSLTVIELVKKQEKTILHMCEDYKKV